MIRVKLESGIRLGTDISYGFGLSYGTRRWL